MRKFLSIIAVFGVFFITGCSSHSESPSSTVTVTAQPQASPTKESIFLKVLHDNTDAFDYVADDTVIALAHSVCNAWAQGASLTDIGKLFIQNGYSAREAGFFIGDATQAFCPQYSDSVSNT